jgi:hypothetical protein
MGKERGERVARRDQRAAVSADILRLLDAQIVERTWGDRSRWLEAVFRTEHGNDLFEFGADGVETICF